MIVWRILCVIMPKT